MKRKPELTVMTLNVWNVNKWKSRRSAVVDWINEVRPDLLALQEVTRSRKLCQASWIAERTDMTATFGAARPRFCGDFGNAVLSRLPVRASLVWRLTDASAGNEPRAVIAVEADAFGRRVWFASTHLSYRFDEGPVREQQVRDIGDLLAVRGSDGALIVCGDFNATTESAEIQFMTGLGLVDAFEVANPGDRGDTWCNANPFAATWDEPDRRIDYIFVGGCRVLSADVVCNAKRGGAWPTDHFGVAARLSLSTPPAEVS